MGHDLSCMSDTNFHALRQLLGCYFNQDRPDEFDDDVAVANAMVANEPADLIAKGIVEINALLSGNRGEDELRAAVVERAGCYFEPASEGMRYTDWLCRLRSIPTGPIAMPLLSVEDIRAGLDRQFLPLEPMLVGFRLIEKPTLADAIEHAESALATAFPDDFRDLIARFDFGHLTIGPIVFGTSGDYLAEIVELNEKTRWWGHGERPNNRLMIANSDPFAILLEAGSGFVYALDPDLGPQRSRKIADSFTSFLQGVGTIVLMRQQLEDRHGLATAVSTEVGSEHAGFWCQLAK